MTYLDRKYEELQWAKRNNKPTLVRVLTELIEKIRPKGQLELFEKEK